MKQLPPQQPEEPQLAYTYSTSTLKCCKGIETLRGVDLWIGFLIY